MNTLGALSDMSKKTVKQKNKAIENFRKRRQVLERYMGSAPGTKLKDKLTFMFGVMTTIFQAWYLGRFPHAFYYDYHSVKISIFLFGKWMYYKRQGWHYYMTDFCYYANMLLIIFLQH